MIIWMSTLTPNTYIEYLNEDQDDFDDFMITLFYLLICWKGIEFKVNLIVIK